MAGVHSLHAAGNLKGSAGGDAFLPGSPGTVSLDGTIAVADLDLRTNAMHLLAQAPASLAGRSVEIIVTNASEVWARTWLGSSSHGVLWSRATLQGVMWMSIEASLEPNFEGNAGWQWLGTELCGGSYCEHLHGSVSLALGDPLFRAAAESDVWLSATDARPLRARVPLEFGDGHTSVAVTVDVSFSDFNLPVEVTPPAASDVASEATPRATSAAHSTPLPWMLPCNDLQPAVLRFVPLFMVFSSGFVGLNGDSQCKWTRSDQVGHAGSDATTLSISTMPDGWMDGIRNGTAVEALNHLGTEAFYTGDALFVSTRSRTYGILFANMPPTMDRRTALIGLAKALLAVVD